jgi:restriction system protein
MPIPDFQSLMKPLLTRLLDGASHPFSELLPLVASDVGVTEEELANLLPSGRQQTFRNRLHWASFYLEKADALAKPKRGWLTLTPRGRSLLDQGTHINTKCLEQFEEFRTFLSGGGESKDPTKGTDPATSPVDTRTPQELLEQGHALHREQLASEVIARAKACSPAFFEQLVVDLLVAMGYGGSRKDAGQAVGKSGDGGIDGIIKEDRLGLDAVYVQAKRWEASVGRPIVQAFAGSLEGHRARKGVLITTSTFSSDARDYVGKIEKRIVLIDGAQLSELMIEHGIGVAEVQTYALKRLDSDYFEEDS